MKDLIPKMPGSVGIQICSYSSHSSRQELVMRMSTESKEFPLHIPQEPAIFFKSSLQQNFYFLHFTLGPWNREKMNKTVSLEVWWFSHHKWLFPNLNWTISFTYILPEYIHQLFVHFWTFTAQLLAPKRWYSLVPFTTCFLQDTPSVH